MKKLLLILLLFPTLLLSQGITIEPMFRVGMYLGGRTEGISDKGGNVLCGGYDDGTIQQLTHTYPNSIEYYVRGGFRFSNRFVKAELEAKTYMFTENFTSNKPYHIEYYFRAYVPHKKFKFGVEHQCMHPVVTSTLDLRYNKFGGYTELYISYNM